MKTLLITLTILTYSFAQAEEKEVLLSPQAAIVIVGGGSAGALVSTQLGINGLNKEILDLIYHEQGSNLISDAKLAAQFDTARNLRSEPFFDAMQEDIDYTDSVNGQIEAVEKAARTNKLKPGPVADKFKSLGRLKAIRTGSVVTAAASVAGILYFSPVSLEQSTNPVIEEIPSETAPEADL
jgi:hypothetical protein